MVGTGSAAQALGEMRSENETPTVERSTSPKRVRYREG
jgi:hypothetical protein